MNRGQNDQYEMLHVVENHFNLHPEVWSDNPMIADCKTAFSNIISDLYSETVNQWGNLTGYASRKAHLRSDLEAKGFVISAALAGYAAGDPLKIDLYNRVRLTENEFKKFRQNEIMGVVTNLIREATEQLPNLGPLGITAETVAALNDANNAFGEVMKSPTEAINHRKNATERIKVLLRDGINLLNTKMDHLIVVLRNNHPDFVNIYHNERTIHHTGSRRMSLTISTIDAVTSEPVANANLEVVGKRISRTSGQTGYNTVRNLVEGHYQLKVSHPKYVGQTIAFTAVTHETTELVVSLTAISHRIEMPKLLHEDAQRIREESQS